MIKSVLVTNHLGDSLLLELMRPEQSGLIITNIEGISPPNATINYTTVSSSDVALYNSARFEARNIVFTFQLCECIKEGVYESVEQVRLKTYKYFPSKKPITLTFTTDSRTAIIQGYVETNEFQIFEEKEETQISIVCPDPFFYSLDPITSEKTYSFIKEFEFSLLEGSTDDYGFENNSLTENLIEFGDISDESHTEIVYDGEYEASMLIQINFKDAVTDPVLLNVDTGENVTILSEYIELLTGHNFQEGDIVFINTTKGQKSVTLVRGNDSYDILQCLSNYTTWFQLSKGVNKFKPFAVIGSDNMEIIYTYNVAYEGV